MRNILMLLCLLCLLGVDNLFCQDRYEGEFAKDKFFPKTEIPFPIGFHLGYDSDERLEIAIKYIENGFLDEITVITDSDTIFSEKDLPTIDNIDWVEIKDGLWINRVYSSESFSHSFNKGDEIKMHYAGYLDTGEPFDNSFIRNEPLQGQLDWFISGFAIGAINVMPNTVRIIKIAPHMAYGSNGGANIPPDSTIYYVIYNLENPRAK